MQKLYVASHVAPYLTKLHPDDREGILVRVCDRPTDTATQELLVVDQQNTDDHHILKFAVDMSGKMAESREKGRKGWGHCDPMRLAEGFRSHLTKTNEGNFLDLACFLMMLHERHTSPDIIAKTLEPTTDFTQELVLDSLPVHGQHRAQPLKVEFDGAEGGCMWLFQEGGGNENIVCVRDTSCAVALANHLLAWAHAESKKPKPSTEEGSTQCAQ